MSVVADLTESEKYLLAILQDQSGVDIAEFAWSDDTAPDLIFRCWDFQYPWYRCEAKYQIDQAGRAIGKSVGVQMRAFAFPFTHASEEMLITAPEMIHLDPVTKNVEDRINSVRLGREFLKKSGTSDGFTHRPFEARFRNGARIIGRIPQKDGKGVKGCVGAGTLILTGRGQVPIEDVAIGDMVLTHRGRWRAVRANYRSVDANGFIIHGGGHSKLVTSDNHRMLGRRNRNPQRTRNLERPDWVIVDDDELPERYYFGSPTTIPSTQPPEMPHPDIEALLQLAGAYVADGCQTTERRRIAIIDDVDDVERIVGYGTALGCGTYVRDHNGSRAREITINSTAIAAWLLQHFGQHANGKHLPVWLLGADERHRKVFLDAYLQGDGWLDAARGRWEASTASKALAIDLRLLAQSLGYRVSYSWIDPKPNALCAHPQRAHRVRISTSIRNAVVEDDVTWQKVVSVTPAEGLVVHDLTVDEDHSYVADGLLSHNQHPTKLEMDEAQDYPEAGWVELGETLKYAESDATWRAHGVSRGVRDRYYKQTQPESGWHVHRWTGMHRNDWTEGEREAKAELYGSRDHPDYRRNVLGLHGDAQSALFVLSRLMQCVDQDKESFYNTDEYTHIRINDEKLRDTGQPIADLLQFPATHKNYTRTWAGMDVGMTNHPSEILIFGEQNRQSGGGPRTDGVPNMRLRCLARVHLERISSPDQRQAMEAIYEFYQPKGFAMDRTGLGLPIFSEIMNSDKPNVPFQRSIRAYNFSEKITVGYERRDENDPVDEEHPMGVPITANVLEYSSDMLRVQVDARGLVLPWDIDMLREFQGQTYVVTKSATDAYGKKHFNKGKFHALDAARMAILAYRQELIDQMAEMVAPSAAPVFDSFLV